MLHHSKGLDYEIIDSEYDHDPTYTGEFILSQTVNLKHVELIKIQVITKLDTSLESS